MNKRRVLQLVCPILGLGFSYLLCRYVFFDLHGMKQWPDLLAMVGVFILLAALLLRLRCLSAAIPAGYLAGFLVALVFHTYGTDPGGGRTSNLWILWTAAYFLLLLAGLAADLMLKYKKRKSC